MKRYVYPIFALSLTGAVISGILLYQHFFPEADMLLLTCGKGLQNSCITVGQSEYATLIGFPNAGLGLWYYLIFVFIILLADYAKESYYDHARTLLLVLSVAGLGVNLILAVLLIKLGAFCSLCVSTYVINVFLLLILGFWHKQAKVPLVTLLKNTFSMRENSSHQRAAMAILALFFIMLFIAVFSTVRVLQTQAAKQAVPFERIIGEINNFYKTPPENISFPAYGIVLGNPQAKVTIYAFTDFLCSACYSFYTIEKYLLIKYNNKIKVVYYHYPLDKECNTNMKDTVYENSCVAAKAVLAAQKHNITTDYIVEHFNRYAQFGHQYSTTEAMNTFRKVAPAGLDERTFYQTLDSKETRDLLAKHIAFANSLKIDATPTLFVAGRRMVGFPPQQIFEEIIKQELNSAYK